METNFTELMGLWDTLYSPPIFTNKVFDKQEINRTIEKRLVILGNEYLEEPLNLGEAFRDYLDSVEREASFSDDPALPSKEERMSKVTDTDISNFMEMYKDIIDNQKFIIE